MRASSSSSGDPYAHLRRHAAEQKQETVDRLTRAIAELEADGRPVTTFTIREVSGLDYMAYYRNREAFQLFQKHSTHLCKKREQEQVKHQAASRVSKRKTGKGQTTPHTVTVSPRDPLLDYKRPRLVQLLHEARAERDEARQKAQAVQASSKQQVLTERAELEQRYRKLLQEHMFCGVTIAKLEAQVAEYLAFMERFRSSLQRAEYDQQE
jgi:phenylpyruvate tautomerase PptA (4-oxalocrotonate tautomerase family)